MKIQIGLDALSSYKRLPYEAWYAVAEFVDNSTQSFFNNRDLLERTYKKTGGGLEVLIAYDSKDDGGFLRVADNAMGMSFEELEHALHIGKPPANTLGRSQYGLGLKTAATWLGNKWHIRTKRLGESVEHNVWVDVETVVSGKDTLDYKAVEGKPSEAHYTVIEIREHNRRFQTRTLGKIKQFLQSMYREDFRNDALTLEWNNQRLTWDEFELLNARDGTPYRKSFRFSLEDGKQVEGWVGILAKGTRSNAGFSIIHRGRVVRGWPDAWRPSSLYGQIQGSNDLINQRLTGEAHLDDFTVSHTKDGILWFGDQEEQVEKGLLEHCGDYRETAKSYRAREDDSRGPSDSETETAIDELRRELLSAEMIDRIRLDDVPPEELVQEAVGRLREALDAKDATYSGDIGGVLIKGYVDSDVSVNDPYVVVESTRPDEVLVMINTQHPHWGQLKGSDGVLNYLRHCTFDAIAEWKARQMAQRLDPDTIKLLKDDLLRVSFEIEMHAGEVKSGNDSDLE